MRRTVLILTVILSLAGSGAAGSFARAAEDTAYLEQAAQEPGAKVLPSGVIYIELEEGGGARPSRDAKVTVNYRGTFTDGREFDASKPGRPARFGLDQVVRCWSEGLQQMKAGGKAKLVCPSKTAYGSARSGNIPPDSTLVFEVELLRVRF